ncbi:MAG: SdpI family protein, partial [Anaerolineaceae bacterium]|nr:SdpI family protein [Anaerolineaceae bacterium]
PRTQTKRIELTIRTAMILILVLWIASLAAGGLVYNRLPERVASHWNERGEVDGYSTRFVGSLFLPLLSGVMAFFLLFIPAIDPLKKNFDRFRSSYNLFVVFFVVFLLYLYALTLLINFGHKFNLVVALIPAYAALTYVVGELTSKAQPNWFIGIRTPWTLSSEIVWQETHRRSSRLFKLAAGVTLLGFVVPAYAFVFLILPLLTIAIYSIVYSYLAYHRHTRIDL